MFTGLIQETTRINRFDEPMAGGRVLILARPTSFLECKLGESIAVNGICLTLTEATDASLSFFVGEETLSKTQILDLKIGTKVNLERSLALGDKLGGHMVSGHVDGTAIVTISEPNGGCLSLQLKLDCEQFRFMVPKGSICVNGVSLTVNAINQETKEVGLYLIPETLARTNLGEVEPGMRVNIECDQLVKIISYQLSQMEIGPRTL